MTALPANPAGRVQSEWVRLAGGVLLAAGVFVLYVRQVEDWGHAALLLVTLLPAGALYTLGFLGRRGGPVEATYLILGTVLGGVAMAELVLTLGADSLNPRLNQALIYFTVAGLAFAAAFLRVVPFLAFAGGIAALLGWVSLLGKAFSVDSIGTYRTLLLIYAALALAAAIYLGRRKLPFAPDLVCVAGVSALIAAALSLVGLAAAVPLGAIGSASSNDVPRPTDTWNLFVLVVALALIAYATRARTRGPAYVGGVAFVLFVGQVGAGVAELAKGKTPSHPGAWAIALVVIGAGFVVGGLVLARTSEGEPPAAPAGAAPEATSPRNPQPPPPPGGWPPPQP